VILFKGFVSILLLSLVILYWEIGVANIYSVAKRTECHSPKKKKIVPFPNISFSPVLLSIFLPPFPSLFFSIVLLNLSKG
jgi:hypothetical protein